MRQSVHANYISMLMRLFAAAVTLMSSIVLPVRADLPIEVKTDILETRLVQEIEREDYRAVAGTISELRGLGTKLGHDYLFVEALALSKTGEGIKAKPLLDQYFKSAGKKGRYYTKALELYVSVERQASAEDSLAKQKHWQAALEAHAIHLPDSLGDLIDRAGHWRNGGIVYVKRAGTDSLVAVTPGEDAYGLPLPYAAGKHDRQIDTASGRHIWVSNVNRYDVSSKSFRDQVLFTHYQTADGKIFSAPTSIKQDVDCPVPATSILMSGELVWGCISSKNDELVLGRMPAQGKAWRGTMKNLTSAVPDLKKNYIALASTQGTSDGGAMALVGGLLPSDKQNLLVKFDQAGRESWRTPINNYQFTRRTRMVPYRDGVVLIAESPGFPVLFVDRTGSKHLVDIQGDYSYGRGLLLKGNTLVIPTKGAIFSFSMDKLMQTPGQVYEKGNDPPGTVRFASGGRRDNDYPFTIDSFHANDDGTYTLVGYLKAAHIAARLDKDFMPIRFSQ